MLKIVFVLNPIVVVGTFCHDDKDIKTSGMYRQIDSQGEINTAAKGKKRPVKAPRHPRKTSITSVYPLSLLDGGCDPLTILYINKQPLAL